MALFLQHKEKTYRVAVWKMEETVDELLALLPERNYYEKEILRFRGKERRREWLSVRALIFSLLGDDKRIGYESDGKPYFIDNSFFLSISHTGGYVAVIISEEPICGIDIEMYGKRIEKVVNRFMRSDEQAFEYESDILWGLLLHWSAKETLFKSVKETDADLRKIRLEHFIPKVKGEFRAQEYWTEKQQIFTISYLLNSDFVLTWLACTRE